MLVLHQGVEGELVPSVANNTTAIGHMPVVLTQTPRASWSLVVPPAGPVAQAVHK